MQNLKQYIQPIEGGVQPSFHGDEPVIDGSLVAFSPAVFNAVRATESYVDDRTYVERCLFARLIKRCVDSSNTQDGADDDDAATYVPPDWFDDALVRACRSGLPTFDQMRLCELTERLDGLQAKYLNPFADRPLMLALMIVIYAYKDLLDQDVVYLTEGTDLADCLDVLLMILNDENHDRLRDGVDRSARKNAIRLIKAMNADGYFKKWKEAKSALRGHS